MSDNAIRKYPLDFELLEKGQLILAAVLEDIIQKPPGSDGYKFAIMHLQKQIESETTRLGSMIYAKCDGNDLRLLTDEEASKYCAEQHEASYRRFCRWHGRNMRVDLAQLSDDQKVAHLRNLEVNGRQLAAIRLARRTILLEVRKRQTPGLPAPEKNGKGNDGTGSEGKGLEVSGTDGKG